MLTESSRLNSLNQHRFFPAGPRHSAWSERKNIVVTKSLSREEIAHCPEVHEDTQKEEERLLKLKTWDEDSHCEKEELISWAIKHGMHISIGDLLFLGSTKHCERAKEFWNFKGRICYRGDSAQDQLGAWDVY